MRVRTCRLKYAEPTTENIRYADDPMCLKSVVFEHSKRLVRNDSRPMDGLADDRNLGELVRWVDVDGER